MFSPSQSGPHDISLISGQTREHDPRAPSSSDDEQVLITFHQLSPIVTQSGKSALNEIDATCMNSMFGQYAPYVSPSSLAEILADERSIVLQHSRVSQNILPTHPPQAKS